MILFKIIFCTFLAILFIAFVAVWLMNFIFSDVKPHQFENDEGYY